MEKTGYERYGLTGNPFRELTSESLEDVRLYHAMQKIDTDIFAYWQEVIEKESKAVLAVTGGIGVGKTERLLLMQGEAKKSSVFNVFHGVMPDVTWVSAQLAGAIADAVKQGFFSTPSWAKNLAKARKTAIENYDPDVIGNAIAKALSAKAPALLLINDIHNIAKATDEDRFVSTMQVVSDNIEPGVMVLMTSEQSFLDGLVAKHPSLDARINRRIAIPRLSDKEARLLIAKRLLAKRIIDDLDPLYPFNEESIQVMNLNAGGNPRRLLKVADQLIEIAAKRRQIQIDEIVSRSVLGQKKLESYVLDSNTTGRDLAGVRGVRRLAGGQSLEVLNAEGDAERLSSKQPTDQETTQTSDSSISTTFGSSQRGVFPAAVSSDTAPARPGASPSQKEEASGKRKCSKCDGPLDFIEKYSRYYCTQCKEYEFSGITLGGFSREHKKCPVCGSSLSFVDRLGEYYCYICKRYPFMKEGATLAAASPRPTPGPPVNMKDQ